MKMTLKLKETHFIATEGNEREGIRLLVEVYLSFIDNRKPMMDVICFTNTDLSFGTQWQK
jgi:hypothetical protein